MENDTVTCGPIFTRSPLSSSALSTRCPPTNVPLVGFEVFEEVASVTEEAHARVAAAHTGVIESELSLAGAPDDGYSVAD